MFDAKFCLRQIPQIFADVDCMLKLKLKVDSRRYFCFRTFGSKNPFVALKKNFVLFVFRCVLCAPPLRLPKLRKLPLLPSECSEAWNSSLKEKLKKEKKLIGCPA
jgi:hypothetical protein